MILKLFSKRTNLVLVMLSFLVFGISNAQAQNSVSGIVLDETGSPLPGASVVEKGTTNGTSTDFDGNFSLNVASEASILSISFIGYQDQDVSATGSPLTITLQVDANALEEVVVVGYGTQKITKVTGAISTVKSATIDKLKPVRVEEALQGQASGVSVIQSGAPGSKPTVFVRGIPNYKGGDPIVIIDGVEQSLDDLSAINAADIESVNVLKDAATTAIYGVKGGNGVIVVTTKIGRKNQAAEFTFNSYVGQQEVLKKVGVLNATEYGAIINEGSTISGGPIIFPDLSVLGVGTNWQDEVFKTAGISSHSLTARGGGENMTYFLSTGFLSQDGIVGGGEKSNFNRLNLAANLNFDLTSKIKLIVNTNYTNIKNQSIGAQTAFNSILGNALNFDPTVSVLNTDPNTIGTYGFSNLITGDIFNPLTRLENTYNKHNGNKFFGKIELQYEIIKDLRITSRFGYTKWDQSSKEFLPLAFYGPLHVSSDFLSDGTLIDGNHNKVIESTISTFKYTHETFANYNISINEKHNFDAVLGLSLSKSTGNTTNVSREDVPFNSWDFADISSATGNNTSENPSAYVGRTSNYSTKKNLSYFGRINYDYKDKYLASFLGRRDGSNTFGKDNKFANFFAGSLGWVVSEEDFFNSETIDFLKFRGSYGTSGNDNIDRAFVSVVTGGPSYGPTQNSNGYTFDGVFLNGSTIDTYSNETLRWEEQTQLSVGFDLTLLRNFSLTADYFEKNVDGLLFIEQPSFYAGTPRRPSANIGSTETSGYEFNLGYNLNKENFKFNTSFAFSTFTSLVTATDASGTATLSGGSIFNGISQSVTRFEKGFSPGYFYGLQTDGLFQTQADIDASPTQNGAVPGDIKFVDLNGDGVITNLDRTKIGNPFPDFTLGWSLGFEYKNVDFSMFTYTSVGNDIFRGYERGANFTNKFRSVLGRWTGPGSTNDANNPRYTFNDANSNNRSSDRYIEDGSFVKIKNVLLGYTVPSSLYNDKWFSKIRIYAQAKNLFTFTEYSGFDPEIAGGIFGTGLDEGAYPQSRTISVGVDLKF